MYVLAVLLVVIIARIMPTTALAEIHLETKINFYR